MSTWKDFFERRNYETHEEVQRLSRHILDPFAMSVPGVVYN